MVEEPDAEKLSAVFESLEFRTLARRVLGDAAATAVSAALAGQADQRGAGGPMPRWTCSAGAMRPGMSIEMPHGVV